MMGETEAPDLLRRTLDLLILKAVGAAPRHEHGIAIRPVSEAQVHVQKGPRAD